MVFRGSRGFTMRGSPNPIMLITDTKTDLLSPYLLAWIHGDMASGLINSWTCWSTIL